MTTEPTPAQNPTPGLMGWALKALPYLALLALVFTVFPITTDDSYITLRYARNLVAGHGPVFNVGEPVEGYSSPLHMVVLALLSVIAGSLDPLFVTKLLSLVFALLMVRQTGVFARRAGLEESAATVGQLLVALNINFALAAVNGLETTLYGFLVLLCATKFMDECRSGAGIGSSFLAVLMLLARPDAALLVAAFLVVRVVYARRLGRPHAFWAGWLGVILGAAAAFLLWRYAYYGSLLPNTYYAKQIPLSGSLTLGFRYFLRGVSATTLSLSSARAEPLKYLLIGLFWVLCFIGIASRRRELAGRLVAAMLAGYLVFMLRSGGDWMLGWRFMVPILPFIAVMQCWGAASIGSRLRYRALAYGLAVLVPALALINAPRLPWSAVGFATDGRRLLEAHGGDEAGANGRLWVALGDYIHAEVPAGARVVYSEMGYAGYANMDKRFLDLRGLTDRRIARAPSKHRTIEGIQDYDWFRPESPVYGIVRDFDPDVILSPTPTGSQVLLGGYRLVDRVRSVEVYAR